MTGLHQFQQRVFDTDRVVDPVPVGRDHGRLRPHLAHEAAAQAYAGPHLVAVQCKGGVSALYLLTHFEGAFGVEHLARKSRAKVKDLGAEEDLDQLLTIGGVHARQR